ncbi:hypothetical protein BCF33_2724 [Hasllibacter halocynthiae]|uniref:Uncharacterized protein n=1 Tax=Hasllibacter halocynthiae TaxID=595589 RepID=A0A2T0WZB9_9RHOB|nr:hypothetical protein [Hasllibacter halocynthiae]PRY92031.1 hypothetical protein BCF33_2724 [Hasllibacter halocynthiae]
MDEAKDPASRRAAPRGPADPSDPDAAREVVRLRRASLAESLDAILGRIDGTADRWSRAASPAAIRRRAKDGLARRVRRHPLGAAMLGAGLAIPALRVLRAVSWPLLLAGGGLALMLRDEDGGEADAKAPKAAGRRPTPRPEPVARHLSINRNPPKPARRAEAPSGVVVEAFEVEEVEVLAPPASRPPRPSASRPGARRRPGRRRAPRGPLDRLARSATDHPVAAGIAGVALGLGLLAASQDMREVGARAAGKAAGRVRRAQGSTGSTGGADGAATPFGTDQARSIRRRQAAARRRAMVDAARRRKAAGREAPKRNVKAPRPATRPLAAGRALRDGVTASPHAPGSSGGAPEKAGGTAGTKERGGSPGTRGKKAPAASRSGGGGSTAKSKAAGTKGAKSGTAKGSGAASKAPAKGRASKSRAARSGGGSGGGSGGAAKGRDGGDG